MIQWHTQDVNINTNLKFKVDFDLPTLIAKKIMTWKLYMDDYDKGRYDMILVRDLLK